LLINVLPHLVQFEKLQNVQTESFAKLEEATLKAINQNEIDKRVDDIDNWSEHFTKRLRKAGQG